MTRLVASFPFIARPDARVLILGSMPGEASLQAGEYYAHPRNAFWPIMRELLGFAATASYGERIEALRRGGIALWDVLQSCRRAGSLDSDIEPGSMVVNDFPSFLAAHREIALVCFNGATAERTYLRHVAPERVRKGITHARLPSTSPAHAALTLADKVSAWRRTLAPHVRRGVPLPESRAKAALTGRKAAGLISELSGLGPKSEAMLANIGITTIAQLRATGSVAAYCLAKRANAKVSLNLLWGLESALTGQPWQEVARLHRTSLLLAVEAHDKND